MSKLSNVPSVLILQALADLRAVEKTPKYRVNMHTFITKDYNDNGPVCTVCLAGATAAARLPIAKELIEKPNTRFYSSGFINQISFDDQMKMYALDSFRQGYVTKGLGELSECSDSIIGDIDAYTSINTEIVPYEKDKKMFHSQMKQLARKLQDRGL